ncbi:hypothetical protein C0992_006034, partial [Termitomyces sp. T32_za158]
ALLYHLIRRLRDTKLNGGSSQFNVATLFFTWFSLANLWLTFSIIIDFLPSQSIVIDGHIVVIHWINQALKWIYLIFLALQFVLALGNSMPKAELRPCAHVPLVPPIPLVGPQLHQCAQFLRVLQPARRLMGYYVEDTMNTQEDNNAAFQETVTRALKKDDTEEAHEKPTWMMRTRPFAPGSLRRGCLE